MVVDLPAPPTPGRAHCENAPPNYLVVSAHDFRSARKANVHFITAELAKRGTTRLFSFGFSRLSKIRGRDPRLGLEDRSNRIETVDGVDCYLWRTPVHPGNFRNRLLQTLSPGLFELYRRSAPSVLRAWARDATVILVESGIGVLLLRNLRGWNPAADIIYIASDDMETIAVDPYLVRVFQRSGHLINGARVPSRKLAPVIPPGPNVFYVPHGVDPDLDRHADPSPFGDGVHAVSVGSMLFDAGFFHTAVDLFPEITFHVIGSGAPRSSLPPTVVYHEEMPFQRTLPFLKHARFGIAPYREANVPYYLGDTSMKLMQYDHFGLPSVCPHFVTGEANPLRFAYRPGDPESIWAAISAAMAAPRNALRCTLTWEDVVCRILDPSCSPETAIDPRP